MKDKQHCQVEDNVEKRIDFETTLFLPPATLSTLSLSLTSTDNTYTE
jgi:hypothetical protein